MPPPSTPLDVAQQAALEALQALVTEEETGFARVHLDPKDAYNEFPCLVIEDDEGMLEERTGGGLRDVLWPLHLLGYVQRGDLADSHKQARSLRARLIDRLGSDIKLGGNVKVTRWREPGLQIVKAEVGNVEYVGLDGVYELIFQATRTYT